MGQVATAGMGRRTKELEMIKALYAAQDEIPENFRDLFEERGGQFHLTKIEGIKTDADVARVQRALDSEKTGHAALKTQWTGFFGERKPEDIQAILDRVPELEAAANGKIDDEKINGIVEGRIKTKLAPVERERDQLNTKLAEAQAVITNYETKERNRTIQDKVREAASKSKVIDTALEDVLMLSERMFEVGEDGTVTTKDGVGVTPGIAPEVWLTEMQAKRPHWWPASGGGGARGGGGGGNFSNNPWSSENWNMTEQGRLFRENPERAKQMAASAGTSIGGLRPVAKK
jgi:hypothetical protein